MFKVIVNKKVLFVLGLIPRETETEGVPKKVLRRINGHKKKK
jgi:hypothetical protein